MAWTAEWWIRVILLWLGPIGTLAFFAFKNWRVSKKNVPLLEEQVRHFKKLAEDMVKSHLLLANEIARTRKGSNE